LRNQDATRRISKWAVELGALNIDFKPRTAIKSQALDNIMVEWRENQLPTPTERIEHWVMYFDGSLKLEGAGAGILLISPTGEQHKYALQIFWKVSNNKAEYEALLHGLRLAASLGINKQGEVRPLQGISNGYSTRQQRTFVLVVERLVLAHQLVALRMHVLDFVMVLGEGAVKF
jgi:hypothetical protein